MPEYEYDLMLSYQSANEGLVEAIATALEGETVGGRPIKVWFAPWDIDHGGNIVSSINEGLAKSRLVALCLSPEALEAEWTQAEQSAAIFSDPAGTKGRVVTVMMQDCMLPPLLRFRKYIDARGAKFNTGIQRLLAAVRDEPLPRGKASRWTGQEPPTRKTATEILAPGTADPLPEMLYTNLFPIQELPDWIYCAPSRCRIPKDVYQRLGRGSTPPGFILTDGNLYSFSPLDDDGNPLQRAVDAAAVQRVETAEWLNDEDGRRRLVQLLNSSLAQFLKGNGWSWDRRGRKFYFRQDGIGKDAKFKSHKRSSGKNLILTYDKALGGRGYYAHRAIRANFEIMGFTPLLNLESSWVFTYDGSWPIDDKNRGRLATRFMARQKNRANLQEVRFMAWLMSNEPNLISVDYGVQRLSIGIEQLSMTIADGIFGDQMEVPEAHDPPDFDETEAEGGDDDLDEEEYELA